MSSPQTRVHARAHTHTDTVLLGVQANKGSSC